MMVNNKFLEEHLVKFKNGYKWRFINEYELYTEVSIVNKNGDAVHFYDAYDLLSSFVINVRTEARALDDIYETNQRVLKADEFFVRTKVEVEIDKGE